MLRALVLAVLVVSAGRLVRAPAQQQQPAPASAEPRLESRLAVAVPSAQHGHHGHHF